MATIEEHVQLGAGGMARAGAQGREAVRVGLLAHVGMQNIGDEILFASALQHYQRRLPAGKFIAFTVDPADTATRYGLDDVHPIRPQHQPERPSTGGRVASKLQGLRERLTWLATELRFSREAASKLRGVDLLIVPGSSQFIDAYGGPKGFPFSLFRWTVLARISGVPICFLSLGAEELSHPVSRWLVRRTIALANYITLRDSVSRERVRAQGVGRKITLRPDLALGYQAPDAKERRQDPGVRTVGVNPIPYYHEVFWRAVDEERYRRYLGAMVEMTASILRRGNHVVLYATTQWADRVPAEDIHAELSRTLEPELVQRVALPEVHSVEDLWRVLEQVDWVVASRYHGVATALLTRKPVVGIAYEQKTADLMGTVGLEGYSLPIDEITGAKLTELLDRVSQNEPEIHAALDAGAERDRAAVRAQFDDVLEQFGPSAKDD